MSDLSFDDVSQSDAGSLVGDAAVMTEHPTFFFRDNMITISVRTQVLSVPGDAHGQRRDRSRTRYSVSLISL
jgi:hypothetical protein